MRAETIMHTSVLNIWAQCPTGRQNHHSLQDLRFETKGAGTKILPLLLDANSHAISLQQRRTTCIGTMTAEYMRSTPEIIITPDPIVTPSHQYPSPQPERRRRRRTVHSNHDSSQINSVKYEASVARYFAERHLPLEPVHRQRGIGSV